MDITDMRYVIASRYNVILISLSLQQSMTFFPLRSQPPIDSFVHHIIYIAHVFGNHFVQVHSSQWYFLHNVNNCVLITFELFMHV